MFYMCMYSFSFWFKSIEYSYSCFVLQCCNKHIISVIGVFIKEIYRCVLIVNIYVYKEASFLIIGFWICVDLRI